MSDQPPHKRPSVPVVKAFAHHNGPNPAPPRRMPQQEPKRPPEVIEALLEEVVARQATTADLLKKLVDETPTKGDYSLVYQEARATRALLVQHMREESDERKARAKRDEAVMGMLGDILARLPAA